MKKSLLVKFDQASHSDKWYWTHLGNCSDIYCLSVNSVYFITPGQE